MNNIPTGVQVGTLPELVKPLSWLLGTWRCENIGNGMYPTLGKEFNYGEEITFSNIGQPMLNYQSFSWHPEKKNPMHLETGFLRIKPGTNNVSFLLSHNFGTFE